MTCTLFEKPEEDEKASASTVKVTDIKITDSSVVIVFKTNNSVQMYMGEEDEQNSSYIYYDDVKDMLYGSVTMDELDIDQDGLTNEEELATCALPYTEISEIPCLNAANADTDGDTLSDGFEQINRLNPLAHDAKAKIVDVEQNGYPDSWIVQSN